MRTSVKTLAFWGAILLLSACGDDTPPAKVDSAATGPACPGNNAGLTLPTGFCANVFADGVDNGRHVVVASNGDVYVTLEAVPPSPEKQVAGAAKAPAPASFVAMRDTNHDGTADLIRRVGTEGNTGIGIFSGFLYVDEGHRIVRYARPDTQLVPTAKAEIIVDGIPLQPGHKARNFAIRNDGALFVNVGSATNSCQTKDRENESPGLDPCTELETRAGVWKFDANKPNQRFAASMRFATGIRNAMGLAIDSTGALFATQHGRDQLHENWPKVFPTTAYQAENPAEELLEVHQDEHFGWPYCYYSVEEKQLVDAPEYGGDGKTNKRCANRKSPVAAFPGHWAPMSLLFYRGTSFPGKYRGGAFIAFHGSWNRAPEEQAGYRVVFQPMTNGVGSAAYETFADGFAEAKGQQLQPGTAKHRPTGLAAGPDGALYITDDAGGRVYRVVYRK